MATNYRMKWAVAAGVSLVAVAGLAGAYSASAEMVYENNSAQATVSREGDRESVRQAVRGGDGLTQAAQASKSADASVQPQSANVVTPAGSNAPAAQVIVQNQSSSSAENDNVNRGGDAMNANRSDYIRRERVREELKNEDMLQERLEELRLRDERKRTEEILNAGVSANKTTVVQEQVVSAPANDGKVAAAQTQVVTTQVETTAGNAASIKDESESIKIGIKPRLGYMDLFTTNGYSTAGNIAGGISLGMDFTDHVGIDVGYTYGQIGVGLASNNPFIAWYQNASRAYGYNTGNLQTMSFKQNVFDAQMRVNVLGSDYRVRPYITGGAAYAKAFMNYDPALLTLMNQYGYSGMTRDYEVNSFLWSAGAGLDLKVAKHVTIGAQFRYYGVISARENAPLNNYAFYGQGLVSQYGYSYLTPYYSTIGDAEKQYVGGSLARSSFYTITAGVSFDF